VPQVHQPGHEAEVDFGEFWALIAGAMVKLCIFSLRLSASGRACHRAFATQAFFEAMLMGLQADLTLAERSGPDLPQRTHRRFQGAQALTGEAECRW